MTKVWMVKTTSSRSGDRRLHPDRACRHLQQANNVQPASDVELETLQLCTTCVGTPEETTSDWSYQQALRGEDPDA